MYRNFKVTEVTKENEEKYLDGIVELEDSVYANMIKQGKEGQLFTTGREDISEYIRSNNNSVFVVAKNDGSEEVLAATYITQGQVPFTYNDVTKYFKCSDEYVQHVKSEFSSNSEYLAALRKIYIQKIIAFVYARDEVLKQHVENIHELSDDEKNAKLNEIIDKELGNPENNFHEKSSVREGLNKNMSRYMSMVYGNAELYEKFYWVDMDFLKKENCPEEGPISLEKSTLGSTVQLYDRFLKLQKYKIHEKSPGIDESKYFDANTGNTIELDTYITSDSVRELGLARIIVFEGIKRVLQRQHLDGKGARESNQEGQNGSIYLVSTLHRDNLSSKYVSEFFGLKDNVFVNRRTGRDREVHICRIDKCDISKYIEEIEKKLIVLYNYNPRGIDVSDDEQRRIYGEQLQYEIDELARLEGINKKRYAGYKEMKKRKITKLQQAIKSVGIQNKRGSVGRGENER